MHRAASFLTLTDLFLLSPCVSSQPPEPGPFLRQVERHFGAWDLDHDGKLSFGEIDAACTDPDLQGEAGAAAATLRKDFDLHDRTLAEYGVALAPTGKTVNAREKAFAANLQKLEGMDRRVFPSALPKGAQLAQGRLGDCFLLAGVGTMAQVQPERLKRLVEELPGGKTAVHLGNGERVELPMPTDAEVIIGSTTRGDGVWGNVFEKAIGEAYRLHQKKKGAYTSPYAIIAGGGSPHTPVEMLTGHRVKREGCEMFQKPGLDDAGQAARLAEIRAALETAFQEGRLVVGGTGPLGGIATRVPGLYYNHSYGVLAYDRATDVVTFWNPLSNGFQPKGEPSLQNGYPTSYGHFTCPLTETVRWFGSFSIERAEKLDEAALR